MKAVGPVQADLAGNILAVLLLVLIVMMQAGASLRLPTTIRGRDPSGPAAAHRAPMGSAALIGFLHDRRPEADGVSFDLTEATPKDLDGFIRGLGPHAAIRLYVFSHRHYAAVVSALTRAGHPWREMSVPPALGNAAGWSPAFLALLDRHPDLTTFRVGLAHLLGADRGAGAPNHDPYLGGLRHRLVEGFASLALMVGLGAVIAIETILRPLPRGWMPPGRFEDKGKNGDTAAKTAQG